MSINKSEYNEILEGVYQRASFNKEIDEFKESLKSYSLKELRSMLADERRLYFLNEYEMHNLKAKSINTEFTKRLLSR